MKRRDERKLEIEALRAEGRAAYEAGRSIHACPGQYVHTMNFTHWIDGFRAALADATARDEAQALDSQPTLAALIEAVREVRPLLDLALDHPAGGHAEHYQAIRRLDEVLARFGAITP